MSNRKPLDNDQIIDLSFLSAFDVDRKNETLKFHQKLKILKFLSPGSTCLVYHAALLDEDGNPDRLVIAKEFYPSVLSEGSVNLSGERADSLLSREEDGALNLNHEATASFLGHWKQFFKSYVKQKELSNDPETLEVIVSPYGFAKSEGSFHYFIISEVHKGKALNLTEIYQPGASLEQKFRIILGISEILSLFEKKKLLFMDLKPENLLTIKVGGEYRSNLFLFDTDSILSKQDMLTISANEIFVTAKYMEPKLLELCNNLTSFNSNRELVDEYCIMYSFGLIVHELLIGALPQNNRFGGTEKHKFNAGVRALYQLSKDQADKITLLVSNLMPKNRSSKKHTMASINHLIRSIAKGLEFKEQRTYAGANRSDYLFSCYDMLEKHPVYEYAKKEGEGYRLDISLVGTDHPISVYMLKTLIPSILMLDSRITLHIYSEKAGDFFESFCQKNPEFKHAITMTKNGSPIITDFDRTLVSHALCHIDLNDSPGTEEAITDAINKDCRYLILLGDTEDNDQAIRLIRDGHSNKKCFIAIPQHGATVTSEHDLYELKLPGIENDLEIELLKSKIFKQAHFIDLFYSDGLHKNVTKEKREEMKIALLKNSYNLESSQRSALHLKYALASIGIMDISSIDIYNVLIRKLLNPHSKESRLSFDRLASLEHLSWTAFMICNGKERLHPEEYEQFAYTGDHDWKLRKDGDILKHPHMFASTPGNLLSEEDFDGEIDPSWDPLDQMSVKIYQMDQKLSLERQDIIDESLEFMLDEYEDYEEVYGLLDQLRSHFDTYYDENSFDHTGYHQLRNKLYDHFEQDAFYDGIEYLTDLDQAARLLAAATNKRNIKNSDNDILFAIFPLIAFMSYEKI